MPKINMNEVSYRNGDPIGLQNLHPKFYASRFLKQTKFSVGITKKKDLKYHYKELTHYTMDHSTMERKEFYQTTDPDKELT